jgi:HAD superfamily hydrolase (TIGR01459 family)
LILLHLPDDARVVLCDVWGCVHDGYAAFPEALVALRRWRAEGRVVVLLTNAPRPAAAIERQLAGLGMTRDCYDALVSSGEAGAAWVAARGGTAGFIGSARDFADLSAAGLDLRPGVSLPLVVCSGLEDARRDPAQYEDTLAAMREAGSTMICLNPDRVALHGQVREICAGVLADRYMELGGEVVFTGKPFAPIYQRALDLASQAAGRPFAPADAVAIGDGVVTDLIGAAGLGIPFVFVTSGIERDEVAHHGEEAFLGRIRAEHRLDDFAPFAMVGALA